MTAEEYQDNRLSEPMTDEEFEADIQRTFRSQGMLPLSELRPDQAVENAMATLRSTLEATRDEL